jgi:carbon starvation protein CstA
MQRWKKFPLLVSLLSVAAIITGVIFYQLVVGKYSGTNILSVMFGWQWLYLAAAGLTMLIVALIKKRRSLAIAALIILASLAAVFVPARIIATTGLYITGDGGPTGPRFHCLVWDRPNIGIEYDSPPWNDTCTLMSIPSYNKFLIDQRPDADQEDASPTYYAMFFVNEVSIVSGLWLANKRLTRRIKKTAHEDRL